MKDVAIIGAGLAGLNCALTLQKAGLDIVVLEASDAPGGRIRTDNVDGFLLDRGFQVLLTAYPEAQKVLDYKSLNLKPLTPGALVWKGGRFHRFADPFREPFAALRLALDPVVTLGDKLRVAKLRAHVQAGSIPELFTRQETTTRNFLQNYGFSPTMIQTFFEPFFGGVFLEKDLVTSSRYFKFLFRMFSTGPVAVPATGMQAIPTQMADRLMPGTLLVMSRVTHAASSNQGFSIAIKDRPAVAARRLVIATEEPEARRLQLSLNPAQNQVVPLRWNPTIAFYFAADYPPVSEPILLLNGEGSSDGPVNNAIVMSQASASYAPAGAHLISASVVGSDAGSTGSSLELEREVRQHLGKWFGAQVQQWKSLGSRFVPKALPLQRTAMWERDQSQSGIENVFLCGDFLETSSIQGSLASGRLAGQTVLDSENF